MHYEAQWMYLFIYNGILKSVSEGKDCSLVWQLEYHEVDHIVYLCCEKNFEQMLRISYVLGDG